MKILALEFSSTQRSVAVLSAGDGMACEAVESMGGRAMQPLSMVETALRQAGLEREQIECLAVGLGPGSYNGIRAAIALAQGWQLARPVKLLGISSVEAIVVEAQNQNVHGRVGVAIDAQRNEFYLASYEIGRDMWRETGALRLVSIGEVQERGLDGEWIIGPEVNRWVPDSRVVLPRAVAVGKLAAQRSGFVPGEKLEPIYLRETTFIKAPPPRPVPPLAS